MTTVYLVFAGEYSDRDLYGVFSTEEKARAFLAKMLASGSWVEPQIGWVTVDAEDERPWWRCYSIIE